MSDPIPCPTEKKSHSNELRSMNDSVILLTIVTILCWIAAILLRVAGSFRILPASTDVLLVLPFSVVALILATIRRDRSNLMKFAQGFHFLSSFAAACIYFWTNITA